MNSNGERFNFATVFWKEECAHGGTWRDRPVSDRGQTKIDVRFEDETVWLTQAQLCDLFQTSKSNISEHIKHIFEEGELDESAVVRKQLLPTE